MSSRRHVFLGFMALFAGLSAYAQTPTNATATNATATNATATNATAGASEQASNGTSTAAGDKAPADASASTNNSSVNNGGTLQEVVITAEKRAEPLNQVAVAGAALTSVDIEKRGLVEFDQLQQQTPSLSIVRGTQTSFINIRGVGLNATTATITGGVAEYVDGLFIWGAGIALGDPFYDLQRVEVLRGPQGTFVGQNSTGGAVFFVSRSPTLGATDFYVQQTVGNYGWTSTEAAGDVPLTEHSALRVAGKFETRNSFFTNIGTVDPLFGFNTQNQDLTTAYHPGDLNDQSVRLKYLWAPSDDLSALVTYERYRLHTDGNPEQPIYNFANALYAGAIKANTNPYLLDYNSPTLFDNQLDRTSAEIKWQITPGISLRSMTGLQHFWQIRDDDVDGTAHPDMEVWYAEGGANPATPYMGFPGSPLTETGSWTAGQVGPNRTVSQEFNLLSTTKSPLQWVAGIFYVQQSNSQTGYTSILENGAFRQQTTITGNQSVQSSGAVFAQITWRATKQLEVIAGARQNRDTSTNPGSVSTVYRPNPQNSATAAVLPAQTIKSVTYGAFTNTAPTGKLSLNWHINDNQIVYAIWSKGYKAGNYNAVAANATLLPPLTFKPESVFDYEGGWKATMFENHFHTDLDAFLTNYDDFQLSYVDPVTNSQPVFNLPKARIDGIELQMFAQFGGLGANLSVSRLIDAKVVDSGPLIDGRLVPASLPAGYVYPYQNVVGNRLPYAPPYTISAGVEYAIPVLSGHLTPRVQLSATGEQWATVFHIRSLAAGSITTANPNGTPDGGVSPDYLPSYHTVDASVTWAPNDTWTLQAFGTNLGNEVYIAGIAGTSRIWSAPRQYGMRFSYQH